MVILQMVHLGNPILRTKSQSVSLTELKTKEFQEFLDNLSETCVKNDGVGIAAPQVGILKRVIVVSVDPLNPRYLNKEAFPLTIIINPKIVTKSKEIKEDWEGDLSADLRGLVPRSLSCKVTGLNREGKEVVYDLQNDFHARVFQHEIDHLDGIMFLDKVKRKHSFSEYEQWKVYLKEKKLDDPFFDK